jgi:hypothetical protein
VKVGSHITPPPFNVQEYRISDLVTSLCGDSGDPEDAADAQRFAQLRFAQRTRVKAFLDWSEEQANKKLDEMATDHEYVVSELRAWLNKECKSVQVATPPPPHHHHHQPRYSPVWQ